METQNDLTNEIKEKDMDIYVQEQAIIKLAAENSKSRMSYIWFERYELDCVFFNSINYFDAILLKKLAKLKNLPNLRKFVITDQKSLRIDPYEIS
jgi:hypothetical protein